MAARRRAAPKTSDSQISNTFALDMPDFMHCSTACLSAAILGDFTSSDSLIIECSLRSDKDLLPFCRLHKFDAIRSPAPRHIPHELGIAGCGVHLARDHQPSACMPVR